MSIADLVHDSRSEQTSAGTEEKVSGCSMTRKETTDLSRSVEMSVPFYIPI